MRRSTAPLLVRRAQQLRRLRLLELDKRRPLQRQARSHLGEAHHRRQGRAGLRPGLGVAELPLHESLAAADIHRDLDLVGREDRRRARRRAEPHLGAMPAPLDPSGPVAIVRRGLAVMGHHRRDRDVAAAVAVIAVDHGEHELVGALRGDRDALDAIFGARRPDEQRHQREDAHNQKDRPAWGALRLLCAQSATPVRRCK